VMPRLVSASLSWVLLQASMFLVAIPIFKREPSLPVCSVKDAECFCS
jgi:hypothetical protein